MPIMASIDAAMLYDMVVCPHRLTMDTHADPAKREAVSAFKRLLWKRGSAHEAQVASSLGLEITDLSDVGAEAREQATYEAMRRGVPLIYGGRIRDEDLIGMPDLLRLDDGGYVAGDIKSAAGEEGPDGARKPKRTYAMQLALYTDVLERKDLSAGRYAFIWDGQGEEVVYELDESRGPRTPLTLWQEYRKVLARAREILSDPDATRPALCSECRLCVWRRACLERLERDDDPSLLPEVGRSTRDALLAEFPTIASLATADPEDFEARARKTPGVTARTLERLHRRARLAREPNPGPVCHRAFELPEASTEILFDVEVDPLRDHCYLHGFIERPAGSGGARAKRAKMRYRSFFADVDSQEDEEQAFTAAWNYLQKARDFVLVHYGPYERTVWRALQRRYPHVCSDDEVEALFDPEQAIDLYTRVIKPCTDWPTRDYSIKSIARSLGFEWRDRDPSGAESIEWYERWLEERDPATRARILAYNEDDCRATGVVLDALRTFAPEEG